MIVGTMRIRFDRHTGKEISRTFSDPYEMSEDEYLDRLITAMTGMSPESFARKLMRDYAESLALTNDHAGGTLPSAMSHLPQESVE